MTKEQSLNGLIRELAEERGLELRGYKHGTIRRRVQRRMLQLGMASYDEYTDYLRRTPAETNELLHTVLIKVTEFFRDREAWDCLAHEVLPLQFAGRHAGNLYKVWSAGCSTGEEAYTAAIMLSEFLGSRRSAYNLKIYATDNDEQALALARRGEYSMHALRMVPREIREKYFTRVIGTDTWRIARGPRRLVIFGRNNLLIDSPISRVDLLICRNVLIYFDLLAQEHILSRLRYALNDGGVLFLGKSESQLRKHSDMLPINAHWRIFQRRSGAEKPPVGGVWRAEMNPGIQDAAQKELEALKLYYGTLLSTLESGILVMDSSDTVITENESAAHLLELSGKLTGKKIQESELWQRCPELQEELPKSRADHARTVRFEHTTPSSSTVAITIRPILSELQAGQVGTLIYIHAVTPHAGVQATPGDTASAAQQLQQANEELETTNEELQSTNEELETTNEELQSTNEELETSNEELQSLNEELETTNEELRARSRELDEVNARYSEMLERMPWPVFLVNEDGAIYMFNSAVQKLFGFASPSEKGMQIQELPLDTRTRRTLVQRHREVVTTHKPWMLSKRKISTNRFQGVVDIHLIPLSKGSSGHGVIVMFEPPEGEKTALEKGNAGKPVSSKTRNSKAAKKKPSPKRTSSPRKRTRR